MSRPAGDELFGLIASIPGSGSVPWCDRTRALLGRRDAETIERAAGVLREMQSAEPNHPYAAGLYAAEMRLRHMAAELRGELEPASDPTKCPRCGCIDAECTSCRSRTCLTSGPEIEGLRTQVRRMKELADFLVWRRDPIEGRVLADVIRNWLDANSPSVKSCECMPQQKFPCGHCGHDVCEDCRRCPCHYRCAQGGDPA